MGLAGEVVEKGIGGEDGARLRLQSSNTMQGRIVPRGKVRGAL